MKNENAEGWSWDGEKLTSLCPIFATIFAVLALLKTFGVFAIDAAFIF